MCMRYFNVWKKHQYWIYIIYMERFLFLISFSFWSLTIWQFLYLFLSHFGFRFSMKDVLLWCLMGVHVDKISSNFFLVLLLIFMIFFYTWSMKKCKIQIQATRCQHFGSNKLGEKCNIYVHIFTNATLSINGYMSGFMLYIGLLT
jgi:hypothetical protein